MSTKALNERDLHDPDEQLEFWSAGDGDSYVYTNSWRMVQALNRKFGRGAEYIRNGSILAWQFKIPKRFVDMLKLNFRRLRRAEIDEETLTEELAKAGESPERPES
ncbi:hypothetical protein EHM92_00855 [bacterium]|nr:MAG: hypothetical protein EHM92_00855 [bacterium]